MSKVRNLVRVNSYRCYFFLPTPAKNLCLAGGTEADGRVARPPASGSVLGIHAPPNPKQLGCCSTPVLAEPGGAGSERWTASWMQGELSHPQTLPINIIPTTGYSKLQSGFPAGETEFPCPLCVSKDQPGLYLNSLPWWLSR